MARSRLALGLRAGAAGLAGLVLCLFFLLFSYGSEAPFSFAAYDLFMDLRTRIRGGPFADPFIVIGQESLTALALPGGHEAAAQAVRIMAESEAAVAVMSSLPASSEPRMAELASALQAMPSVVVGGVVAGFGDLASAPLWAIPGEAPPSVPQAMGYIGPRFPFSDFASGSLNIYLDHDGILRRVPLLHRVGDRFLPSVALQALMKILGARASDLSWENGRFLRIGASVRLAVDSRASVLLDFPRSWPEAFFTYDLTKVAESAHSEGALARLRQELQGGYVFLMEAGSGTSALYAPSRELLPAAAVSPLFVNQILNHRQIRDAPRPFLMSVSLLLAFSIAASMVIAAERTSWIWLVPLVSAAPTFLGAGLFFALSGLFMDPLPFLFFLALAVLGGLGWQAHVALKAKSEMKAAWARERSFAELGKRSAGITHGIKGQAALALNFARLLQAEALSDQGRKELDFLIRSIEELSRSLAALGAALRKDAGPSELEGAALLRGFHMIYAEGRTALETKLRIQDEPLWFKARQEDVLRILEIFYSNAVDACAEANRCPASPSEGGFEGAGARPRPVIELGLWAERGRAVFEVADAGRGIPACLECDGGECMECEAIALGKTSKREGSGYGLYWARSLIRKNNAELSIRSRPGSGTCVRVAFAAPERD